jgi:hypothetical protein
MIPPVYVTGGTLVFRSTMRVCASRAPVTDGSAYTNSHNDRLYLYAFGIND